MFCEKCGNKNNAGATFCATCGSQLRNNSGMPQNFGTEKRKVYATGKNNFVALVLSLLICGLGQFYNGDVKKGFLMLGGGILGGILSLSLLWWVAAIWSAIDAYNVANGTTPLWK